MSKRLDFLRTCGIFFVSTINGKYPATRPFGAAMELNGNLYISTSNRKNVYSQILSDPHIQITALKAGTRDWIRITGTATESTSTEDKCAMLNQCPTLQKRFESEYDENFALIKVIVTETLLYTERGIENITEE